MANHGLRTTGTHTGNFGRAKVQAGARLNDIGMTNAEVVNVTRPEDFEKRLSEALGKTEDARLKEFIGEQLKALRIQRGEGLKRVDHSGRTAPPYRTIGA